VNKVALITGASRGIGAQTALLAAENGYDVCVNYYKQKQEADSIVQAINNMGRKAIAVCADVSDEEQVLELFNAIDKDLGLLTALVNNAGILFDQTTLKKMNANRLNRLFSINITGSFLCAREAIKRMSTHHQGLGGSIVNVSSMAARLGSPNEYIDYAASKGAIDTMTIGLAKEVAAEGIRVNAVRPGLINTDIHASGGDPGRVERLKSTLPMQRGGEPLEVAQAVLWFLSDDSSYTTGSFIDVSGGR
jgi:NAD(P)-dependent dehydrogenase (short-subunit alcohol dehydrogenase family)